MLEMPLRTRYSAADCIERLNKQKEEASAVLSSQAIDNGPHVHVQKVDKNTFTVTCSRRRGRMKIDLIRYNGQISEDSETGGVQIDGEFTYTSGIKAALWGVPMMISAAGVCMMIHMQPQSNSKLYVILLVGLCIRISSLPFFSVANNAKEYIYRYLESLLEAQDTRKKIAQD